MQNFDLKQWNGNEPVKEQASDYNIESPWREAQFMEASAGRGLLIIDTGGYEVSALNE